MKGWITSFDFFYDLVALVLRNETCGE